MYLPVYPHFSILKPIQHSIPYPGRAVRGRFILTTWFLFSLEGNAGVLGSDIDLSKGGALAEFQANWNTLFSHVHLLSVGNKQTNKKINHFKKCVPLSKANNVLAYWFKRWMYVRHFKPQFWSESQWHTQATGFPLQRTGVIWTFTLCLSVGSCIMLLAAVFCFFVIISFLSQTANSKAILVWVFMKNLWPSEQHQWGLCPLVWCFLWGNQQCAVFIDQGRWNCTEILFPFIQCGILRPSMRLFSESYWEGTTFCTLLILKISLTTDIARYTWPYLGWKKQSQPLIPDNA